MFERFQPDKPVKFSGSSWTRSFTQDGKLVDVEDMISDFAAVEETKEPAKKAEFYFYAGLPVAVLGGMIVGWTATSKGENKEVSYAAGAGSILLAFWLRSLANDHLLEASEIHNKNLGASSTFKFEPFLDAVNGRAGLSLLRGF